MAWLRNNWTLLALGLGVWIVYRLKVKASSAAVADRTLTQQEQQLAQGMLGALPRPVTIADLNLKGAAPGTVAFGPSVNRLPWLV